MDYKFISFYASPSFWKKKTPFFYDLITMIYHFGDILQTIEGMQNKFGKTFCFRVPIFQKKLILTGDVEIVEYMLKSSELSTLNSFSTHQKQKKEFDNYIKGGFFSACFSPLLGKGIFNVDGDEWSALRKKASHMFNVKSLKEMLEIFKRHGKSLVQLIKENEGGVVDFQDLTQRFTLDSIGEIAFGYNIDSLHNSQGEFALAFNTAQLCSTFRIFFPFWMFLPSFMVPSEVKLKSAVKQLNEFCYKIVRERKSDPNLSNRTDILSEFLKEGDNLSDQFLRDQIMNFIIAGLKKPLLSFTIRLIYQPFPFEIQVVTQLLRHSHVI